MRTRASLVTWTATLAIISGCAAARAPLTRSTPPPQSSLVLAPTPPLASTCFDPRARVELRGHAELVLDADRPTVLAGLVVDGPARLTLRSEGTSPVWLFLDVARGPITIDGDIGSRRLRISATGPGPRDAYEIHMRELHTGGIAYASSPVAHIFVEEGVTFATVPACSGCECGFCGLDSVAPPPRCTPAFEAPHSHAHA